jgi:hypothetical protein
MKIVKLFLFVLPVLILLACDGDSNLPKAVPVLVPENTRIIKVDPTIDKVDLYFLNKEDEFNLSLPLEFISTINIDTTIRKVFGEQGTDYYHHEGCTYDLKGRVVNSYRTTCMVCSFMPYGYDFSYNSLNQVISIVDKHSVSVYEINYDSEGDVKELIRYDGDEKNLVLKIKKLN